MDGEAVSGQLWQWRTTLLTRSGTVMTAVIAACGAVMLYLLSTASSNTPLLAGPEA